MLKAVLDTQVILRGATSARPTVTGRIYDAWDAGRFTLLLSESILEEIEDVVSRAEVRRRLRMTAVEAAALLELLRRRSIVVTPGVRIARSRDHDRHMASLADSEHEEVIDEIDAPPLDREAPTRSWMKVKVRREGAFPVGGIAITEDGFAGALVGRREDGELRYLGTVEFGYSERLVGELFSRTSGLARPSSPFVGLPREEEQEHGARRRSEASPLAGRARPPVDPDRVRVTSR